MSGCFTYLASIRGLQTRPKQLAEKLMVGSVRLAQENPEVPHAKLRMNVCSPGGSSIVGVNEMDRLGVRGAIIETVLATHRRALEMSAD